ncbi:hypothetical protein EWM64_g7369 [Hericium alpestre]|uniref:Uncharacterized protein n=1 Tax=Hericium alpestre TaxID=135208 RepID=A0A4Y9ZQY0_9AGAM|nr:hypothetical protein EWM64_g7369 [Hericium alpestre]
MPQSAADTCAGDFAASATRAGLSWTGELSRNQRRAAKQLEIALEGLAEPDARIDHDEPPAHAAAPLTIASTFSPSSSTTPSSTAPALLYPYRV